MFRIYYSNALDHLKDLLVTLIQRDPAPDPFTPESILVESPGMAQWLKLELAQSQGISANVDFPLPATFLWGCFARILPDVPERSAYDKEAMTWKLMNLLPRMLDQPDFAPLKDYLATDNSQFRLYQLCSRVADIFDQYLVYRPDWIADWDTGLNAPADTPEQRWQPQLWRALRELTETELQQPHWHRANMLQTFIERMRDPAARAGLPRRLFVFGISALPQSYLQVLKALSQHSEIHLMVMNPCQYYWGDIVDAKYLANLSRRWWDKPGVELEEYYQQGNPLLASTGKLGRDYIQQLIELDVEEGDFYQARSGDSLLHGLHNDILHLENRTVQDTLATDSVAKQLISDGDNSVQLHACHSPLREVEVLHDQLLAMFEADPELSPRDVIVMMPDVASYAPYIDAVFGHAPGERYIPYSISDRSVQQEHPLLNSFLKLLKLGHSRFSASEVLDLLAVPATLRRFELSEDDFSQISRWVERAQVRWGLSGGQREQMALPGFEQNSWQFGLKRMLAGFALGETETLWEGVAPFGDIEGLAARLLGPLAGFIEALETCAQRFTGEKPLHEWLALLSELLDDFYSADADDELALSNIRQLLERLHQQHAEARFEAPLSIEVLADYLAQGLQSSRSSQRFMIGRVNFCTLMPMRSIPFKRVCLLGMNDGVYPRSMPPLGFDLIAQNSRRGDRSRRDDDRYLFLEALLSATQSLYISYVGRSIRDNSPKVASVLVSELVEYLCQSYCRESDRGLTPEESGEALRDSLLTEHLLVPYNRAYFTPDSPLFSFDNRWLAAVNAQSLAAEPFADASLPLPGEVPQELELDELLRFFRHPARALLNRRLRVFFDEADAPVLDEEPFALDGLDKYLVRDRLLKAALKKQAREPLVARLQQEGALPYGAAGQRQLNSLAGEVDQLVERLEPALAGDIERRELNLSVIVDNQPIRLSGWLEPVVNGHLICYRPAKIKGYDKALAWLKHLALCAHQAVETELIYLDRYEVFEPVPQPEAVKLLTDLVAVYLQGMRQPLPLPANTTLAYLEAEQKGKEGLDAAQKSYLINFNGVQGEGFDAYWQRCFTDFNTLCERGFADWAERVYQPMFDYQRKAAKGKGGRS